MNISEVKFAKSGDVHRAYQRYGQARTWSSFRGWSPTSSSVGNSVLEFDKRCIGSLDRFTQHPTLP